MCVYTYVYIYIYTLVLFIHFWQLKLLALWRAHVVVVGWISAEYLKDLREDKEAPEELGPDGHPVRRWGRFWGTVMVPADKKGEWSRPSEVE